MTAIQSHFLILSTAVLLTACQTAPTDTPPGKEPSENIAIDLEPGAKVVTLDGLPDNHIYPGARAPLSTHPLRALPPGSVRATTWLLAGLNRLGHQLHNGNADPSSWWANDAPVHPEILRARTRLALVTADKSLQELVDLQIQTILSRQQSDGWIGPRELAQNPSWSSAEHVIQSLRDVYAASPRDDLLDALHRYVRFQSRWLQDHTPKKKDLTGLLEHTGHLAWLYNEHGDPGVVEHLVEMDKAFMAAAGNEDAPAGSQNALDELIRRTVPEQNIDDSTQIRLLKIRRQALLKERANRDSKTGASSLVSATELTFSTFSSKWSDLAAEHATNTWNRSTSTNPPAHQHAHAVFALSTYVSRAWLAGPGDGLVATAYVPCRVQAWVGEDEGTLVTLNVQRPTPRSSEIVIDLEASRKVLFPLGLRVPNDCQSLSVHVNGGAPIEGQAGTYLTLSRLWRPGDRVEVKLCPDASERI